MNMAATGHRPKKLGHAYNLMHPINIHIGKRMREFILTMAGWNEETQSFRDDEIFTNISGMAIGVDTIWAMVTLKLKRQFPGKFRLKCAIPCINHESRWSAEDQKRYHQILEQADEVIYVSKEPYNDTCMYERDKYMVNDADYLYGIWDGSPSGTKNTIDYAKKQNVLMYVEDPTPWIEEYQLTQSVS